MAEDMVSKDSHPKDTGADALRTELTDMMGPVQWELLKPHVQRDAVVVVNPNLDLVDVGVAIATDNTQSVARWINEQLIVKPNAQQLAQWGEGNHHFQSLIVQPYVLVQDAAAADTSADTLS